MIRFKLIVLCAILLMNSNLSFLQIHAKADPSSWTAIDGLGRTVSDYEEAGPKKSDKYVGIFYWTWHDFFSVWQPRNLTEILKEYPEAANDTKHKAWANTGFGYPHFWDKPLFGYYSSKDAYVIRKHAELLADAGVDVLFFDCTNGTNLFLDSVEILFKVFTKAKEEGINVPKICFMLNINPNFMMKNNNIELKELYKSLYSKDKYKDLWFYWEDKPLVLSTDKCLDVSIPLENEIYDFFTFRRSDDMFDTPDTDYSDKMWGWVSVYPQTKYGVRDDGTVESMVVSIAQNYNDFGLTAMNDPRGGVHGRSHTTGDFSYSYTYRNQKIVVNANTEDKVKYGLNFQQQWDYVHSVSPDLVFVTGWNEWIAGRAEKFIYVDNAFPDQYSAEYSRDIEPSAGELKDYYYYQLVSNIRRYKGVSEPVNYTETNTIDIKGDISQWDSVSAVFDHYTGNTRKRSQKGYGTERYKSDTMRNDVTRTKVAYDNDNIYFYVETVDNLTNPQDDGWMRLLLDTEVATQTSKDWEGFEYIINRISPSRNVAYLERSTGEWNWEQVGEVEYSVKDNVLQITVPRTMIGKEDNVDFNFKWSDNMQTDGDILDFYQSGDVTPGGRFMFTFRGEPSKIIKDNDIKNSLTLPWYAITALSLAGVSVLAAIFSKLFQKKQNS